MYPVSLFLYDWLVRLKFDFSVWFNNSKPFVYFRYTSTKADERVDDERLNSTELELRCFIIDPQDLTPEPAVRKKEKSRKKRQPRLPVEIIKQQQHQYDASYYNLSHTDSDECTDSDTLHENKRKRDTRALKKKMDSISGQKLKHSNSRFPVCRPHIKGTNLKEFHENFSMLIRLGRFSNSNELKEQVQLQKRCNELIWRNIQAWYNNVTLVQQDKILTQNREKIPGILNEIMNFNLMVNTDSGASIGFTETSFSNSVPKENTPRSRYVFTLTPEIVSAQKYALKRVSELLDKLDFCERQYPTTKALGLAHTLYDREDFVYRVKSLCLWLSITRELCHKIRLLGRVLQQNQNELTDWPWLGEDKDIEKLLLGSYESDWSINQSWGGVEAADSSSLSDIAENKSNDGSALPSGDENSSETSLSTSISSSSLQPPPTTVLTLPRPEVKFNLSDSERSSRAASPSPTTNPTAPPLNNLSKFSCSTSYQSYSYTYDADSSDELYPKISFYHSYVDRGLKKMGMHKLMKRLLDLLDGSLRRAEESLRMPPKNNLSSAELMPVSMITTISTPHHLHNLHLHYCHHYQNHCFPHIATITTSIIATPTTNTTIVSPTTPPITTTLTPTVIITYFTTTATVLQSLHLTSTTIAATCSTTITTPIIATHATTTIIPFQLPPLSFALHYHYHQIIVTLPPLSQLPLLGLLNIHIFD